MRRTALPPQANDPFGAADSWVGLDVVDVVDVVDRPPTVRHDAPRRPRAPASPQPPRARSPRPATPRMPRRPRGQVGVAPGRRIGWRRWLPIVGVTLATLAVLGALAATLNWALTAPYWRVRHIVIQGTSDVAARRDIYALPLGGCDIFRCDEARAARLILATPIAPLVTQVVVTPSYPDTLVVTVALRRPALLWRTAGRTLVVAEDGVVLGAVGADGALASDPTLALVNLPLINVRPSPKTTILKPGDHLDETMIAMATQLRLPEIAGALGVAPAAVTLAYDGSAAGLGFFASAPGAPRVIFGGPDAAAALASDMAPQTAQAGLAAPSGEPPTVAQVTQGAQLQLATLRSVVALLAQNGQQATLIDLRWGAHPYEVVG